MTEVRTFSPWCQMCLDGEDRGRLDAHELHVLRMERERAQWHKQRWGHLQWKLTVEEAPAAGKQAGAVDLVTPDQVDQQTQPAQRIND